MKRRGHLEDLEINRWEDNIKLYHKVTVGEGMGWI
jgi:hypothetical protein